MPWTEVIIAFFGGCSLVIQALCLYIIGDLRDRIVRLEAKFFADRG
jgi:hypothetical protein